MYTGRYNCIGLNVLFDGHGFTKLSDGSRGVAEYLVENVRVATMACHQYAPMAVTVEDLRD